MTNNELIQIHKDNGGFTYNPSLGIVQNISLFAVSIFPEFETILDHLTSYDIEKFYNDHKDLLDTLGYAIGAWHNPEDDKDYLDIAKLEEDKNTAIDLAIKHNQYGIFDLSTMEYIPVESGRK